MSLKSSLADGKRINHDISLKKREIDAKLEEEKASITWLKESLQKSDTLANNMINILTSFEERLCKLEDNILPVHKETTDLQRRQDNISKTLVLLEEVLSYHSVSSNLKPIVESGPAGNLNTYLETLKKIENAITFFKKNNPESIELSVLNSLNDSGRDLLVREFRLLLQRNSRPIAVLDIQNMINSDNFDESNGEEKEKIQITHFPESIMAQICMVSSWLVEKKKGTDFMSFYSQIRSNILSQSLLGVKNEPDFFLVEDNSGKKKAAFDYKKKLTKKATKQVIEIYKRPSDSSNTTIKDEEDDYQVRIFLVSTVALLKLMQSEHALMTNIIPAEHQVPVFSQLVQDALNKYYSDAENVSNNAKKMQSRMDHSSVQFILPVLKYLVNIKPQFDSILKMVNVDTRKKFLSVISLFHETGKVLLSDFVEKLKDIDKNNTVPKDGTVHQVTSNVAIYLEELMQFIDTTAMILSEDSKETSSTIVAGFMSKVLESLSRNLMNKSKMYDSMALQSIFMLNNYNYIIKSLQKIGIMKLLQENGQPDLEKQYDEVIKDEMESYEKSWQRVSQHLVMDSSDKLLESSGKLNKKHKQAIKEKFKGFNTDLEEIHQLHRQFSVPDITLKKRIEERICQIILPSYSDFLKRYRGVNFTRNVEKYVKYDLNKVQSLITSTYA
ncbi:exocyst complex component 7 isoform X2 [Hydra vulgaris]|uniref:Exocyst complex component 7 n=1 Tax=Hydra vulgaris TaxID=6087 RepID=A0ABM4CCH4_HYDVU